MANVTIGDLSGNVRRQIDTSKRILEQVERLARFAENEADQQRKQDLFQIADALARAADELAGNTDALTKTLKRL